MTNQASRSSAPTQFATKLLHQPYVWAIVALLLLLVVNLTKNPAYLSVSVNAATGNLSGNLIDILRASAPIMMIAVGMTLVIATRGIDLSVGSVMAVAGAVSMEFMQSAGTGSFGTAATAVLLALGISALLGTLNGILVSVVGLQPFITTLVMMLAGRGLAKVITSGQNTSASNEPFRWIANGTILGFPVVFVLAAAIVAILAFLVRRTALGLMIEAIGINPKAARMAGIRPVGILISVYVVSAVLAGVAGIFSTASVMTVEVAKTGMTAENGCDPRRGDRRNLSGRREVLSHRQHHRRTTHRHARQDDRLHVDSVLGHSGVQGRRHRDHLPAAVAAGASDVLQTTSQYAPHAQGSGVSMTTALIEKQTVPKRRRLVPNLETLPTLAAVVIFIGMVIYGEIAYGRIVQFSTVSNLLINNAYLIILAVGLTFVIVTGGIDLSVGAVIAISSLVGVMLANSGWNPLVVIVLMILIGSAFGLASGVLIQYFNVQPFIATLAMMFLARGLAAILSTTPQRLDDDSWIRALSTQWKVYDGPKINDLVTTPSVLIAVAVVIVAFFLLHRTRFGRTVYAIGGSEQSALLMGLPVVRTKLMIYVISGTLAGLAAVVYTSKLGIAQNITGIGWELDAIAAVIIGGTLLTGGAGFVLGSVIGALVLGLMNVLITRDGSIPPEATTIITGGILLAFVLLQRVVVSRKRKT
jgi:ribose/xylose/arabinose/galactoside ABC-type transport system permease subunit